MVLPEFVTELWMLILTGILVPVFIYGSFVFFFARFVKVSDNSYKYAVKTLLYSALITVFVSSLTYIIFTQALADIVTVALLTILTFVFAKLYYKESVLKTSVFPIVVLILGYVFTYRGEIALYFL